MNPYALLAAGVLWVASVAAAGWWFSRRDAAASPQPAA